MERHVKFRSGRRLEAFVTASKQNDSREAEPLSLLRNATLTICFVARVAAPEPSLRFAVQHRP